MAHSTVLKFLIVFLLFHSVQPIPSLNKKPWTTFLYVSATFFYSYIYDMFIIPAKRICLSYFSFVCRENGIPYSRATINIPDDVEDKITYAILTLAVRNSTINFKGYDVLAKQTTHTKQPPEWILLDLRNRKGVTTLAKRSDNLYLHGYTDSEVQWYEFAAQGGKQLIPGSIIIEGMNGDYDSLGGIENLVNVPLSKKHLMDAVQVLLDYRYPHTAAGFLLLQRALATIVLMGPESARFKFMSDIVEEGWNSDGVYITNPKRLVCWKHLSRLLLTGWPTTVKGNKGSRMVDDYFPKHQNKDEYLGYLNVLLYPIRGYRPPP